MKLPRGVSYSVKKNRFQVIIGSSKKYPMEKAQCNLKHRVAQKARLCVIVVRVNGIESTTNLRAQGTTRVAYAVHPTQVDRGQFCKLERDPSGTVTKRRRPCTPLC